MHPISGMIRFTIVHNDAPAHLTDHRGKWCVSIVNRAGAASGALNNRGEIIRGDEKTDWSTCYFETKADAQEILNDFLEHFGIDLSY